MLFRALVLLLLVLPLAFSQSSDSVYSNDWTMFHRFNNHSGFTESSPPSSPQLAWYREIGFSIVQTTLSSVASGNLVYIASQAYNSVYALKLSTGELIWNRSLSNSPLSIPAISNGIIYAGTTNLIYALNASNGSIKWSYSPDDYTYGFAVYNGFLYFGTALGTFYSLNASTGSLNWTYDASPYVFYMSPAAVDGVIYASSSNGVGAGPGMAFALNASDGSLIWNRTLEKNSFSSPAVYDGRVYLGDFSNKSYALNASDGSINWTYQTGAQVLSSPAVAYGMVYFGSRDGGIYALNASDGSKIWNRSTSAGVDSSPAIANGTVVIGSMNSLLYVLNASNGENIWNYTAGGGIRSSPIVVDGMVFFSANDMKFYALGQGLLFWPGDLSGQLNVSQTCGSEINATALNFGSLVPGQTSTQQSLLLTNIGSWNTTDITIDGTDWISTPTVNFTANYTKWSNETGFAYDSGNSMTNSPASMNFNLTNNQTKTTFFRVQIPLAQATATYTQNITLTTIC